jgi:hypothetical protein
MNKVDNEDRVKEAIRRERIGGKRKGKDELMEKQKVKQS